MLHNEQYNHLNEHNLSVVISNSTNYILYTISVVIGSTNPSTYNHVRPFLHVLLVAWLQKHLWGFFSYQIASSVMHGSWFQKKFYEEVNNNYDSYWRV